MLLREDLHGKIAAAYCVIIILLLLSINDECVGYLLVNHVIDVAIGFRSTPGGSDIADSTLSIIVMHDYVLVGILLLLLLSKHLLVEVGAGLSYRFVFSFHDLHNFVKKDSVFVVNVPLSIQLWPATMPLPTGLCR